MPTVRYVSVEGPGTGTVAGTDALLREIAARYLPPDKASAGTTKNNGHGQGDTTRMRNW